MIQPTTTPSAALRIHQPPDGPTPLAPVNVPAPVSTPAEIAAAIGAKASRYATSPSKCRGCGRPTLGSFGPKGVDGLYIPSVCQSCKDEADRELQVRAKHGAMVASLIHRAATEPALHDKGTDRLLAAIAQAASEEHEQPERFDEMTGPMPDESGASGGYGFSEKSPRYEAAIGCGCWVVRDNRPGPQDPWEVAVGLGEDEARKMAEVLNSGGVRPNAVTVPALISALQGLREIIHDDLSHARQRDHHEAIRAADVLLAAAKGGGK